MTHEQVRIRKLELENIATAKRLEEATSVIFEMSRRITVLEAKIVR